jgi:hypothetical protein
LKFKIIEVKIKVIVPASDYKLNCSSLLASAVVFGYFDDATFETKKHATFRKLLTGGQDHVFPYTISIDLASLLSNPASRVVFFAISGVVNRHFLTISCLVIIQMQNMAEKIKINLSNEQKKCSEDNFIRPLKIGKVVQL